MSLSLNLIGNDHFIIPGGMISTEFSSDSITRTGEAPLVTDVANPVR